MQQSNGKGKDTLPSRRCLILATTLALSTMVLPQIMGQSNKPGIEAEIIAFTPLGFQPAKITRPPGPFLLVIHNATRLPSLEFSVVDDKGKLVKGGIKLGVDVGHSYRDTLDVGVGTYTMRIKELPTYTMTIVISSNGK